MQVSNATQVSNPMQVVNLKAYLANIGMTLKDFAAKIECHEKHLSRIMLGKSYPSRRLRKDVYVATDGVIFLRLRPGEHKNKKKREIPPEES